MDVQVLTDQEESIYKPSTDTRNSPEDLSGAMNDRDEWRVKESQRNPY